MDWTHIQRTWIAQIPNILTRWPDLDEDEVLATSGERDAFTQYLAQARGVDMLAAESDIGDWMAGLDPVDAVMDDSRDNERIKTSRKSIPTDEDVYSDDRKFGDDCEPETPVGRT